MHFLQRQIRLCSSRIAQPLENAVDFDENNIKVIDIPKIALQTQSQPIQHEPDNGHLFKVSNANTSNNPLILQKCYHYPQKNEQKTLINNYFWALNF